MLPHVAISGDFRYAVFASGYEVRLTVDVLTHPNWYGQAVAIVDYDGVIRFNPLLQDRNVVTDFISQFLQAQPGTSFLLVRYDEHGDLASALRDYEKLINLDYADLLWCITELRVLAPGGQRTLLFDIDATGG